MANQKTYSPARALRRLGFRQTIRGALIVGILTGLMMGAQGAAYAAAYPDQHSRDIFVESLRSIPSLGFMAGEIDDALTPASYSIYKSIALTTLLTGIWSIMVVTRLLRGQEEDGRMESIVASKTTKAGASIKLLTGFAYSFFISLFIAWGLIALLGLDPNVKLSAGNAALLTLGVYAPGVFFGALGVLTSQLALTRGRALAYGLFPLLALFAIRGAGNSIVDWNWLKHFTPFGWTDLLNSVRDPHAWWLAPTLVFALVFTSIGLYFVKRRDLGQSILPQSTRASSRFFLLGSDMQLAVRQNIITFIGWGLGTLSYVALLAAIAKVAADALSSSPMFVELMVRLGGSYDDIAVAFIGFGMLDGSFILLVMAAVYIGSLRGQEAKGYLDNILIQPVRRSGWLIRRLIVIIVMTVLIYTLSGYTIWQIGQLQGIDFNFGTVLQNCLALSGIVVLLVGIGTLFYGMLPRFASIAMFAVIVWSLILSIIKAFFSLHDWIDRTGLVYYISFAPNKTPDWTQFWWLVGIGVVLMAIGVWRFTRRDIVNE